MSDRDECNSARRAEPAGQHKAYVARMARLGQYVTEFASKGGWNPEDGEGAFEFIQRHSYTVGYEDAGGKVAFGGTQTNGSRWPISALVEVSRAAARTWQPITKPGQVKAGDKLRFTIGDKAYSERVKIILHAGTDKEEVIYDKGRNFYFITSMVISGKSNHKGAEVSARRSRVQGGHGEPKDATGDSNA